tara:strand:+ start:13 stop:168 length:156 start_codon:yes stop_codon:yes gene_type:complete
MQTRPSGFLRFPGDSDGPDHAEAAPMAELMVECKDGFAATGVRKTTRHAGK